MHVNAIAKNAADDKLRQSLRRFAHTYPAPSTVVLISGDINFSSELTDLRHVHNITIVLVHNPQASDGLKVFAHTLISFDEFLADVEAPHEPQVHVCAHFVHVHVHVYTYKLTSIHLQCIQTFMCGVHMYMYMHTTCTSKEICVMKFKFVVNDHHCKYNYMQIFVVSNFYGSR